MIASVLSMVGVTLKIPYGAQLVKLAERCYYKDTKTIDGRYDGI